MKFDGLAVWTVVVKWWNLLQSENVRQAVGCKSLFIQLFLDFKPVIVIDPVVSDSRDIVFRWSFSERRNIDIFYEPCQGCLVLGRSYEPWLNL